MPRKKVGVKKLKRSKEKSTGTISIEELESIILEEEWKEIKPKVALSNALAKIEELEEQIDHPDYYGDGDHDSPTFAGQREEIQLKSNNADKMIQELDSITAFFVGVTITASGIAMLMLVLLLV